MFLFIGKKNETKKKQKSKDEVKEELIVGEGRRMWKWLFEQ